MQKGIGKFVAAIALLVGATLSGACPAAAQTKRFNLFGGYSYGTSSFLDSGYYYGFFGSQGLNGYSAAFAVNLNNHIGLEANFSGHRGTSTLIKEPVNGNNDGYLVTSDQSVYTYAFGPRLFQPIRNFSLFTHFLVGGVHLNGTITETCTPASGSTCSYTTATLTQKGAGFAFLTGGGLDWNHGRWGVRILEIDYVHGQMVSAISSSNTSYLPLSAGSASTNSIQMATGITFNFGKSL